MLEFTKMQGAGNDFIVFDGMARTLPEYGLLARAVCSRRFGIGADGILVARASDEMCIRDRSRKAQAWRVQPGVLSLG